MKNFAELDAKICSCTSALTAKLEGTNGKRTILLCGGTGCVAGIPIFGAGYDPMLITILAPGGFMVFGLTLGIVNTIMKRSENKKAKEAN